MPDNMAVTGVIATDPRNVETPEGLKITSFRLASQQRKYDRAQAKWVDAETNWYTVVAFRGLAENAEASLNKGEHIVVRGRLRMRDWTSGEKHGVTMEIEADAIGHDLSWGRTTYRKVVRTGAGIDPAGASDDAEGPVDTESPSAERELVDAIPTPF